MVIIGIDPGLSGAGAIVDEDGNLVTVFDMPTMGDKTRKRVDASLLSRIIKEFPPALAIVEHVHSMPGQGLSSTFAFGRSAGAVDGVLAALDVSVTYVDPRAWKKAYRLSASKEDSRRAAIEMWPKQAHLFERVKDHGRAEAALIARWGTARPHMGGWMQVVDAVRITVEEIK